MVVVVADRGGIVGAAVRHALRSKSDISVVSVSTWPDVEYHLRKHEKVIVLSAQTIKGVNNLNEFALRVKEVNKEAGFFVYNGNYQEGSSLYIDGFLPSCKAGQTVESVVGPFVTRLVATRSVRPIQLQLF